MTCQLPARHLGQWGERSHGCFWQMIVAYSLFIGLFISINMSNRTGRACSRGREKSFHERPLASAPAQTNENVNATFSSVEHRFHGQKNHFIPLYCCVFSSMFLTGFNDCACWRKCSLLLWDAVSFDSKVKLAC